MTAARGSAVSGIKVVEGPILSQAATSSHRSRTQKNGSHGQLVPGTSQTQARKSVVTDFCALSDRSLVEVVSGQDRAKSKLSFLIWNAEKVSVVDQFEHDGNVYTPPALEEERSKHLNLRFPSGVKACPTPGDFFIEVSELIRSYVDLPEAPVTVVAAFALSTWVRGQTQRGAVPVDLWSTK